MEEKDLLKVLEIDKNIFLEDIPQIDLYMDQVIQLFENTFNTAKRNEDEKILTKTMINNYAKGKLLIPIKNKKYSREHLILLSLIYQLKSGISINDIKATLNPVNQRVMDEEAFNLEDFYKSYLALFGKNGEEFKRDIETKMNNVAEEMGSAADKQLKKVLLILSFITASQFYRRAAETLVDELISEQNEKKEK
ncbi:DUF1836 domain-containing protein [Fredinandcohnia sp. QZ13]|uniref:DUF1836 domain-containing protein n=1 Tax=Fredinandcohnia sp. QZ13 TaxID=3073144 RepID=UPI00285350D3|nr:DUF1836 domain-containing protein [Fredinandcohnia sp. QZ13]MDR4889506.1 DUF1836 domain-containing protein [Fredinandcohnia sp. QZ13]